MGNSDLEQKWLETDIGKICYFSNIKFAEKPTVVFLHGLSSNHTTWSAPMQALEKLGLNALAPDLRGHGHSDKTKKRNLYKFSVFAHDLEAILQLCGSSRNPILRSRHKLAERNIILLTSSLPKMHISNGIVRFMKRFWMRICLMI